MAKGNKGSKGWETDLDNMVYIIRDEGTLPLGILCALYGEVNVSKAQSEFMTGLRELMQNTFQRARVAVINAREQIEKTRQDLAGLKTISLDTFYTGTYNLELTRLFKINEGESEFIRLINRPLTDSIEKQISKIEKGDYIIVDDDAVGGRTIQKVKELLPPGVNIVGTCLMMDAYRNKLSEPILDVVDCRDFLIGVDGCGLTTLVKDIGVIRIPYVYPFVDIEDKANIPSGMERAVSKQIWELNRKFWNQLDKEAKPMTVGSTDLSKLIIKYKLGDIYNISMQQAIKAFSGLVDKGVIL